MIVLSTMKFQLTDRTFSLSKKIKIKALSKEELLKQYTYQPGGFSP
jgi:hypothetical protein